LTLEKAPGIARSSTLVPCVVGEVVRCQGRSRVIIIGVDGRKKLLDGCPVFLSTGGWTCGGSALLCSRSRKSEQGLNPGERKGEDKYCRSSHGSLLLHEHVWMRELDRTAASILGTPSCQVCSAFLPELLMIVAPVLPQAHTGTIPDRVRPRSQATTKAMTSSRASVACSRQAEN
jgi:hypothetical protein